MIEAAKAKSDEIFYVFPFKVSGECEIKTSKGRQRFRIAYYYSGVFGHYRIEYCATELATLYSEDLETVERFGDWKAYFEENIYRYHEACEMLEGAKYGFKVQMEL